MILQSTVQESVSVETYLLPESAWVPNNPTLSVLVMANAVAGDADSATIRALIESHGWCNTWCWSVFDWHHYHPDAHEVLAVASGWAKLILGGPGGPVVTISAGDILILPAGTGHCRIGDGDDFAVCGGYPRGQGEFTTVRDAKLAIGEARKQISAVGIPDTDPIFGVDGPLRKYWSPC